MTKTIAQLWSGKLNPIEYLGINNKEIKNLENLMQRNLEKLENNLDEKSQEIFEKYNDCINEYISILCEQSFCDGFCLGTKIVTEALNSAEQIISNHIANNNST